MQSHMRCVLGIWILFQSSISQIAADFDSELVDSQEYLSAENDRWVLYIFNSWWFLLVCVVPLFVCLFIGGIVGCFATLGSCLSARKNNLENELFEDTLDSV